MAAVIPKAPDLAKVSRGRGPVGVSALIGADTEEPRFEEAGSAGRFSSVR
jgi:hypothetical protein